MNSPTLTARLTIILAVALIATAAALIVNAALAAGAAPHPADPLIRDVVHGFKILAP